MKPYQDNSASRIQIGVTDDSGAEQYAAFTGLDGESWKKVMRVQPHGFSSVPPVGSHALAVALGGRRDLILALGGEDPNSRPTGLAPGSTAIYNASGEIIKMVGKTTIATTTDMTINASSSLTIKCGSVVLKITSAGVAITGGSVTHNGHDIGSDHKHTDTAPGGGLSGVPE